MNLTPGAWQRPYRQIVVYDDDLGCIIALREDVPDGEIIATSADPG